MSEFAEQERQREAGARAVAAVALSGPAFPLALDLANSAWVAGLGVGPTRPLLGAASGLLVLSYALLLLSGARWYLRAGFTVSSVATLSLLGSATWIVGGSLDSVLLLLLLLGSPFLWARLALILEGAARGREYSGAIYRYEAPAALGLGLLSASAAAAAVEGAGPWGPRGPALGFVVAAFGWGALVGAFLCAALGGDRSAR